MKNMFNTIHRCGYSNVGIARRLGVPEKSIRLVKSDPDLFFDLLYGKGKSFKYRKIIRQRLKSIIKTINARPRS